MPVRPARGRKARIGLAVGVIAALAYGYLQYNKLQYALTLNMTPPQVQ